MRLKEAHMTEFDLLNAVWWLWCNQKIIKEESIKEVSTPHFVKNSI